MASSPAHSDASHESGDESDDGSHQQDGQQSSKGPALKDKECPYCHQKFTSSSLGRHLDQFISKKKPDGIHNVDEIRRLRAGITRRTARNAHKKEHDEPQVQPAKAAQLPQQFPPPPPPPPPPPSAPQPSSPQYTLPSYSELVNKTATKEDIRFNRANWQATGVITETTNVNPTPAVPVASPAISAPSTNTFAGQKRSFSTYAADLPTGPNSETSRALELSLREVLDAIRIATKKAASPSSPFDFNFESQTFPFLCLALLPAPPTLFQSTPFATSATIPLSAPGQDQYRTLGHYVSNAVDEWKWNTLSYIQRSSPPGTAIAEELDNLNDRASSILQSAQTHVDAAYQNYMSYPSETRQQLWVIELLRGFKTEQDKTKDAKATIDRMRQEMNQLQQQLDHLSTCQWPREMALWPPERPTFDSATQDELRKLHLLRGMSSTPATPSNNQQDPSSDEANRHDRWDYDRLISKWRRRVREDRARRTGAQPSVMVHQPSPTPAPPPSSSMPAPTGLNSDIQMNMGDHSSLTNRIHQSPKSMPASTPRLNHNIQHRSSDLSNQPRPASAAPSFYQNSNTRIEAGSTTTTTNSAENSPLNHSTNSSNNTPNGPSSTSSLPPSSTIIHGYGPGAVPPPPRSRPLGIISDADEYYGPRLHGYRRESSLR